MSRTAFYNASLVFEHSVERGGLLIEDGRIAQTFTGGDLPAGLSADRSIDLLGFYLAPGMIDIHIHGSAGVDVQAADHAQLARLSEFLLGEGITSYFATFVPAEEREYLTAVSAVESWIEAQGRGESPAGARVLGIHFEGPFVNENRCGALKREHFRSYDDDPRSLDLFCGNSSPSSRRLMTLAPEVRGGIRLARQLGERGVRVFIGHSQADPETLDRAVEAGARHITHFPNALDPLHHRKPGAVAWGLLRKDVSLDCIVDFQHVHPLMLRLIYETKGADRIALISDAIQPAGLGDGVFTVWGEKIAVRDGRTSLIEGPAQGTIAGSVITMRHALKNTISLGVPLHEAVRMTSTVPARVAGIESERGSIAAGKSADLVAYDEDFRLRLAMRDGQLLLDGR
ncbi:MAG TPA: N-acetylglucosamine-6-phosphate deacetylase [Blastocatellia bacterium]|nr:N-acetylglucosamine-6-phosphate deacetylase [Blastocatellia bacterium]